MKDKAVILVVDDQPQNIELLEAYLAPQGYEIVRAALAEIEKNKGTFYDNTVADACLRLFREKGYQLT